MLAAEELAGITLRDEADAMTAYACRNGHLENRHAGIAGFPDEDMKKLMIESSARLADLHFLKSTRPDLWPAFVSAYALRYCSHWSREALSYELRAPSRHPCNSCGKDISNVWRFCASCGSAQETEVS
jgi:hypothetical protein